MRPRSMRPIFVFVFCAAASALAQVPVIETVAGSGLLGDGGPAVGAVLRNPRGLAADFAGNLYIAETGGHRIRKVSRAGIITTLAGTGVAGFSGDGSAAVSAQLNAPYGLVADAQGNLYVADLGNARVRRISADGIISTVAGGGTRLPGGANEAMQAVEMALAAPRNLLLDDAGNLYLSDFAGHRVFRMNADGTLVTVAGTGVAGSTGNGAFARDAQLAFPAALAFDFEGGILIADTGNHAVRRVLGDLISQSLAVATPTGLATDFSGGLWVADPGTNVVTLYSHGAVSRSYRVASSEVVRGGLSIYATEDETGKVWKLNSDGSTAPVAGGGSTARGDGGVATLALLQNPSAVAFSNQSIYIADRDNNRIRRVDANGVITTIAAGLKEPSGLATDSAGNVLIADSGNGRVFAVSPTGTVSTVLQAPQLISPSKAIAGDAGSIYIADGGAGKIVKVNRSGAPTVVREGLSGLRGLALLGSELYFTEESSARVGRMNLISGVAAYLAEGTWRTPRGIAVSETGHVFVADTGLQQIVHLDPMGNRGIIAGSGTAGYSGDGAAAVSAQLNFPWDVAFAGADTLLIADLANHRVRRVNGVASTMVAPSVVVTPPPVVVAPAPSLDPKLLNAASQAEAPIVPDMLAMIRGTGISASALPELLVLVNSVPAEILSLDDLQMQIHVPRNLTASGDAYILIIRGSSIAFFLPVRAAVAAPALFDPGFTAASPAQRGSVISLFGTGLGLGDLPVSVTIAGLKATIVTLDPSPGYPGLFEIKLRIPESVGAGTWPVKMTAGNSASQAGIEVVVR